MGGEGGGAGAYALQVVGALMPSMQVFFASQDDLAMPSRPIGHEVVVEVSKALMADSVFAKRAATHGGLFVS